MTTNDAAIDTDPYPDDNVGDIVDPDIDLTFAPAEDEDGGDDE